MYRSLRSGLWRSISCRSSRPGHKSLACAYNICIEIEWDPNKAAINRQRHGVRFSDAEAVLFDPNAVSMEDEAAAGERRFVLIGLDYLQRLLVVVYTDRGENIRLISARPATGPKRRKYETGI
jgi:uncharacterized protein